MRTLALVALAAFVAAPLSGASPTSTPEYTVVAHSKIPTVQMWKARLSNELNHKLATSSGPRSFRKGGEGFAVIEFRCGPDGLAQEVGLVQSSRDGYVDRTAMRAVASLRKLHPMPGELQTGQKVRANIILSESEEGLDRALRQLRKAETSRAIAATKSEHVIVLNAGLRVQG